MEPTNQRFFEAENSAEALRRLLFAKNRKVSVRQISKKLGFASDRTLGMALKGQRIPSAALINRVAQKYRLTSNGLLLMNLLAQRDRLAAQRAPTAGLDEEIRKVRPLSVKYRQLSPRQTQAVQAWYCYPAIEILRDAGCALSAAELRERLRGQVSSTELSSALKTMAEMELIALGEDGKFSSRTEDGYFMATLDLPSQIIREIHRRMLTRAEQTLEEQSVLERDFVTKTMTIPLDRVADAKVIFRNAVEELSKKLAVLAGASSESVVIQLGAHLFQQSQALPAKTITSSAGSEQD